MAPPALRLWLLPVVGLASWTPLPLSEFRATQPAAGAAPGTRRFSHAEHRALPGGGGVHLSWEVEAEPESILALDWERRHGISLVECGRDRLVLHVPHAHSARAARWRHVTASGRLHGCQHLAGRALYHRVLRVASRAPAAGGEALALATEELPSASQLLPRCSWRLALVPPGRGRPAPAARRLGGGGPQGMTAETVAAAAAVLGLEPQKDYAIKQNFSWSEQDNFIQLREELPGAARFNLEVDAPLFEGRLALDLSYDSKKGSDGAPPEVKFKGDVDLDLNFDASAHASALLGAPSKSGDKPVLLMGPPLSMSYPEMSFYLGPIPITIKPSVDVAKVHAKVWGTFNGSASVGLKANTTASATMVFDTAKKKPLVTNFSITARDVRLQPPLVLVATQDFRLDFGLAVNLSVAPYFNASMSPALKVRLDLDPETPPSPMLPPAPVLPPPPGLLAAPALPCYPHDIRVSGSADLQGWASFAEAEDVAEDVGSVSLSDLLPEEVCVTGACQGYPLRCSLPAPQPVRISQVKIVVSRALNRSTVSKSLVKQVAYALGLVPSVVELVGGYASNRTKAEDALREVEHEVEGAALRAEGATEDGLEKEQEDLGKRAAERMEELVDEAGQDIAQLMSRRPRQLAAAGGARAHDTFVLRIQESPAFKITGELLRRAARAGGLRLRDGRERELGPIRVTHMRLLGPAAAAPGEQLWERPAPAAARAGAAPAATLGALGALAAAAVAGLVLRRRRGYLAAPPEELLE